MPGTKDSKDPADILGSYANPNGYADDNLSSAVLPEEDVHGKDSPAENFCLDRTVFVTLTAGMGSIPGPAVYLRTSCPS